MPSKETQDKIDMIISDVVLTGDIYDFDSMTEAISKEFVKQGLKFSPENRKYTVKTIREAFK